MNQCSYMMFGLLLADWSRKEASTDISLFEILSFSGKGLPRNRCIVFRASKCTHKCVRGSRFQVRSQTWWMGWANGSFERSLRKSSITGVRFNICAGLCVTGYTEQGISQKNVKICMSAARKQRSTIKDTSPKTPLPRQRTTFPLVLPLLGVS